MRFVATENDVVQAGLVDPVQLFLGDAWDLVLRVFTLHGEKTPYEKSAPAWLGKGVSRSPYEGIGKPEALKENLSGYWSRRIHWKSRKIARKFLCIFHSFLNNVLVVQ